MDDCNYCKDAVWKVSLDLRNITSEERIKHVTESVRQVLVEASDYSKFQCSLIVDDLHNRLTTKSFNSQLLYSGSSEIATKIMKLLADRDIISYLKTSSIK